MSFIRCALKPGNGLALILFGALLLTSAFPLSTFAQTGSPEFSWGPERDVDTYDKLKEYIGEHRGFHFVRRTAMKLGTLSMVNSQFRPIRSIDIEASKGGVFYNPLNAWMNGNELFWLFVEHRSKETLYRIRGHRISADSMEILSTEDLGQVDVGKKPGTGPYALANFILNPPEIYFSPDSSLILISHRLPKVKKEFQKLYCMVIDTKFQILWEKTVDLPYNQDLAHFLDMKVDNQGNVHVLTQVWPTSRDYYQRKINYTAEYLCYEEKGTKPSQKKVEIPFTNLSNPAMAVDDEGHVFIFGKISAPEEVRSQGLFYMVLDPKTKDQLILEKLDLGWSFFYESEKSFQKDKTHGVESAQSKYGAVKAPRAQLVNRADGGAFIVLGRSEKGYSTVTQFNPDDHGRSFETSTYPYGTSSDLLVFAVDPDQKLAKVVRVPKRKYSASNWDVLGYSDWVAGNTLHLVYYSLGFEEKGNKDGTDPIRHMQVSPKGELSQEWIGMDANPYELTPMAITPFGKGSFFVYGRAAKGSKIKERLGTMTIK